MSSHGSTIVPNWEDKILPAIGRRSVPLQSLMQYARPTFAGDGKVVLTFPPSHQFALTTVDSPPNLELLESVLGQAIGYSVRVRLEVATKPEVDRDLPLSEGRRQAVIKVVELCETIPELVDSLQQLVTEFDAVIERHTMPYRAYLASSWWQSRRKVALERAHHACQICNSTESLDVHHRTYKRRGMEHPDDLVVLCRDCHGIFHENGKLAKA